MAKKTVMVSDLTGQEIPDGHGATIRIVYEDARRGVIELDALADELADWTQRGRKVARRGRRPGQKNQPATVPG